MVTLGKLNPGTVFPAPQACFYLNPQNWDTHRKKQFLILISSSFLRHNFTAYRVANVKSIRWYLVNRRARIEGNK